MILNPQLLTEIFECVIFELLSIIIDEDPRDAEMANDNFPKKTANILLCNGSQGFGFNPLREIINSYDKGFELPHCHGERSHYIKALLSEWPGSIHWGKLLRWLPNDVTEPLAFVACLYVGLGVFLHGGPIVPNSY